MKKKVVSIKKKSRKNSATRKKQKINFLLVLVLVIVAGFVIYTYLFPKQVRQNSYVPTPSTTDSPLSPTPTINPATYNKLSDAWNLGTKSFSNPKLAISFDYPSYFDLSILDFKAENEKWADNHKTDPNIRQPLYPTTLDFTARVATPTQWLAINCENKMTVSVWQYDNPNLSVYDFISNSDRKYSGASYNNAFTDYKKGLKSTDFPKPGSYIFKGVIHGPSVEEVYFQNNGKIFQFILTGSCGEEAQYSSDAEAVFNNILRSIKYL